MARTIKQGLDYLPIDVNFFSKPSILRLSSKMGVDGELMAIKFLLFIAEFKGCYVKWDDESHYYFAATRLFNPAAADKVKAFVEAALDGGFFDKSAYENDGILTSKGIYQQWKQIVLGSRRRIDVENLPDSLKAYDALDGISSEEITENGGKTGISSEEMHSNDTLMQQRKEKKSTKERKKEREEEIYSEEIPEIQKTPVPIKAESDITRETVCRSIWVKGISVGLVDSATYAVRNGWTNLKELKAFKCESSKEHELYLRSNGRYGCRKTFCGIANRITALYEANGQVRPTYGNLPEPEPLRDIRVDQAHGQQERHKVSSEEWKASLAKIGIIPGNSKGVLQYRV